MKREERRGEARGEDHEEWRGEGRDGEGVERSGGAPGPAFSAAIQPNPATISFGMLKLRAQARSPSISVGVTFYTACVLGHCFTVCPHQGRLIPIGTAAGRRGRCSSTTTGSGSGSIESLTSFPSLCFIIATITAGSIDACARVHA